MGAMRANAKRMRATRGRITRDGTRVPLSSGRTCQRLIAQGGSLRRRRWTLVAAAPRTREASTKIAKSDSPSPAAPLDATTSPLPSASVSTAATSSSTSETAKGDVAKATIVGASIAAVAAILGHEYVQAHEMQVLTVTFIVGYCGIIFEESLTFNKAGVSLVMAASLWTILATCPGTSDAASAALDAELAEVSQVIFFLLGAMTIVEVVDAHGGFRLLTERITTRRRRELLWIVGLVTFFMSAVLDNLTSTIVMCSLLRSLAPRDADDRRLLGAVVVIAANAGGAWTPIGDVTTTMLWIGGQITALPTMRALFVPSLVSLLVPLAILSARPSLKGDLARKDGTSPVAAAAAAAATGAITAQTIDISPETESDSVSRGDGEESQPDSIATTPSPTPSTVAAETTSAAAPTPSSFDVRARLVLGVGVGALLFMPIFKQTTGLPPYLGMLSGLGALWLLTDALHYGEDAEGDLEAPREDRRVPSALRRIDTQGVLFFFGILMSVGSLDAAGLLDKFAAWMSENVPSEGAVASIIGLGSAVIDNVPLVAATMGMYDINTHVVDEPLWQLIAYCAGTGGSILIIGSAAGVAFMGMERVGFGWYTRTVAPLALAGYAAGLGAYAISTYLPPLM